MQTRTSRESHAHIAQNHTELFHETTINPAMRAECSHHSCAASLKKDGCATVWLKVLLKGSNDQWNPRGICGEGW
jgi:hypothetical protein